MGVVCEPEPVAREEPKGVEGGVELAKAGEFSWRFQGDSGDVALDQRIPQLVAGGVITQQATSPGDVDEFQGGEEGEDVMDELCR